MTTSCMRLQRRRMVSGIAALTVTACSGGNAGARIADRPPPPPVAPAAAGPVITIVPAAGSPAVPLSTPVTVHGVGGVLEYVVVRSTAGTPLLGRTSAHRSTWTSMSPLDPATTYAVQATAQDAEGRVTTAEAAFTTLAAARLTTSASPTNGSTVGVGTPIRFRFSAPVPLDRRADLVSHVHVDTTPAVIGAWHWFSATEVHWRPSDLWPSGTRVTVTANLRGVDAGGGVWGLGDFSFGFAIGDKHVSVIDVAAHQMQVFDNDQLVHTYPVSAGRPSLPTLGGTLVVWYRQYDVLMDSSTIGIPRFSHDGYYEHVYWDTAISTDGFYIHSAPWSEASQGNANVSHGCVNLSPQRAEEFYQFSRVGDVVQVINTPRVADASDGEADWQIPFSEYANTGSESVAHPTPDAATTSVGPLRTTRPLDRRVIAQ